MKILKIALKNLNSLKLEQCLDFTQAPLRDAGLFAIVGDTGAGKTTILDALTLGLYGQVHRNKDEKEVLSYGEVDGYAEVEFEASNAIFRGKWIIWRSRGKVDGKQNVKRELAKWNPKKQAFEIIAEKIRDITEKVENITGLDYERFCKSVLLSQGDFAAFLKAGNKDRSNLLERITGTEVYSQISIAAYQRHKIETQKLEVLQKELDALHLLDKAAFAVLKKELKDTEKEAKGIQKQINLLSKQSQWRHKIIELRHQKEQDFKSLQLIENIIELAATDFIKLVKHQHGLVFQKDLTILENLEAQAAIFQIEKQTFADDILTFQNQKTKLSEDQVQIASSYKAIKEEESQKEQLFEEVLKLDVQLEEKDLPFQELTKEKEGVEKQLAENAKELIALNAKEKVGKKLLKEIEEWLEKNHKYKNVQRVLPVLRNLFADWGTQQREHKSLEKELNANENELSAATATLTKFEKQLSQQKNTLQTALEQFYTASENKENANRTQMLETLNQEIERLDGQFKNLKMLIDLNEDYQKLIGQLTTYDEEIRDLEQDRAQIEQRLLTAIETEEALAKTHDYKLQMYEREKLFANYDSARSKLSAGEKCPLCFSTEHPFRFLENYTPYVDEAEKEYQSIKARLEIIQKETKKLARQQNQISNQIHQIIGEQEKKLDGKRDLILDRIKVAESKIAQLAPELLDESLYHIRKGDLLNQKLDIIKESLLKKRTLRNKLIQLHETIHQREQKIVQLNQQTNEEKIKRTSIEVMNKNLKQKLAALSEKEQNLHQKIAAFLEPYDLKLAQYAVDKMLNLLEKKRNDFEKANDRQLKEKEQLVRISQELLQAQKQEKEIQNRQSLILKKYEKSHQELTTLQAKRHSLFGANKVETARVLLKNQIKNATEALDNINQALKEVDIHHKNTIAQVEKKTQELNKLTIKIAKEEQELLKKIEKKGFENIAALKQTLLPVEEVEKLEKRKATLQKQLTQRQQSLENTSKTLAQTLEKDLTTDSIEAIQEKYSETEANLQQIQQQIGRYNQQIEDNNRREEAGKNLLKKMDVQQKEFNRWAKLKNIIGSADGKLFRAFAQGLTLKKLSELANRHLLQLNGRYLIHKPNDRDLELEIIDTYQANNIRSIHTLSGGESFLVSLALALGLSDLAGKNTQIKSLFIDEGFGTLDESALDLAISTLENLQSGGKSIGVISHVTALKERITTQIQIQKQGSGFSEIALIS